MKQTAATFEAAPRTDEGIREPGGTGSQPPYVPPPMTQKLTRLPATLSFPGAPPPRLLQKMDQCAAELKAGLAEVARLDGDLPKLNKMMQEAGVPYVTPDPAGVPAQTGGRGGGEN